MEIIAPKVIFMAYGRAGLEVYEKHLAPMFDKKDIFVITYASDDNRILIEGLLKNNQRFTTDTIKSDILFDEVKSFQPSIIISMHFRDLIPKRYLEMVNFRAMNLHPSLLPKYAGCFATMWALIEGEVETGVTYHLMNERFDKGNILHQTKIQIQNTDTGESLYNKAIDVAVDSFPKALELLLNGSLGTEQMPGEHYYPRVVPFNGIIDKEWPEQKIKRFIRAFNFKGLKGAILINDGREIEIQSHDEYLRVLKGIN